MQRNCVQAIALLVVAFSTPACHSASTTDVLAARGEFEGDWNYASGCANAFGKGLLIRQAGATITGTWHEGTTVRAETGEFVGQLRGRKLFLSFCTDRPEQPGEGICPDYREEDAYVVRSDDRLVLYRRWGSGFRKEMELARNGVATGDPADCGDSDNAG